MTQKDKLIDKIMQYPTRKDIEFDDLIKVLESYDFETIRMSGSHCIFKNKKYPNIVMNAVPRPHGGNKYVKRPYVDMAREAIKEYIEMENKDNEKK